VAQPQLPPERLLPVYCPPTGSCKCGLGRQALRQRLRARQPVGTFDSYVGESTAIVSSLSAIPLKTEAAGGVTPAQKILDSVLIY